jgi:hypothetical protein
MVQPLIHELAEFFHISPAVKEATPKSVRRNMDAANPEAR